MTAIVMWFCTDCLAGNCGVCADRGPRLDDGTVCECEHDDLKHKPTGGLYRILPVEES